MWPFSRLWSRIDDFAARIRRLGSLLARLTAGLLNSAGSMRLLTNGALNVICRPALQAGEAKAVKSPASIAGSRNKRNDVDGSWRIVVP